MKELEFHRMMLGMVMPTATHKAVLKALVVDNDQIIDGTDFALCFGAVSRVPVDRINKVTMREMQEEFGFPMDAYVCADPGKPIG